MSYDLMVFDPKAPPSDRAGFMAWFGKQTRWETAYDYNDPTNCLSNPAAWFFDIRQEFPALNGPFADFSGDGSKFADYSIGKSFIYACFAWTEATNAHRLAFDLAKKHSVGFFNVSEKDGEVWAPQPSGIFACIHGTGRLCIQSGSARESIAKVSVIKTNKH